MKTERELVMDLSLLVARMARRLRRNGPTVHDAGDRALADQAVAYLQRHRLTSPLREVDASPPADVPAQVVADSIPKGVDAGKPGYLHALIDHLLMPPPAMTESHLRKLHNEVAEMLNLFSKHLKRMASTSLGHAMKVEAQASQALTQYNAGSTGQGDAGGVTGQCPVCHVEDGQHQRGCRNIPGVKGEGNG
jgi:hypothetical protein